MVPHDPGDLVLLRRHLWLEGVRRVEQPPVDLLQLGVRAAVLEVPGLDVVECAVHHHALVKQVLLLLAHGGLHHHVSTRRVGQGLRLDGSLHHAPSVRIPGAGLGKRSAEFVPKQAEVIILQRRHLALALALLQPVGLGFEMLVLGRKAFRGGGASGCSGLVLDDDTAAVLRGRGVRGLARELGVLQRRHLLARPAPARRGVARLGRIENILMYR